MTTEKTLKAILQQFEELKKQLELKHSPPDRNGNTPNSPAESKKMSESRFLKFNDKEIFKMPKTFRKEFRYQGCTAHVRKRCDGRYKCSYEIRYDRNGYHLSASATTLDEAKERFIQKLNEYEARAGSANAEYSIPKNFDKFAMYWFENFHKLKVTEKTYKNNLALYHRHIEEHFKQRNLNTITPKELKTFLTDLPGNGKTQDDVHCLLNQIFETAVTHGLIKINPIKLFVHLQHERENGTELTFNEEITLLNASKDTDYQIIFAVLLYTGLRPNEYDSARIENQFIIANNSKQKKGKHIEKKIPICSHLLSFIKDCTKLPKKTLNRIREKLKIILPNHTIKDLRKTFSTRCVNCHVDDYARKKFMGHSVGNLDKPYVGGIDTYLLTEGKKLENWYTVPQIVPQK